MHTHIYTHTILYNSRDEKQWNSCSICLTSVWPEQTMIHSVLSTLVPFPHSKKNKLLVTCKVLNVITNMKNELKEIKCVINC